MLKVPGVVVMPLLFGGAPRSAVVVQEALGVVVMPLLLGMAPRTAAWRLLRGYRLRFRLLWCCCCAAALVCWAVPFLLLALLLFLYGVRLVASDTVASAVS